MQVVFRWLLPVVFVGIGSAIWAGLLFPSIPAGTGLRPILGIVTILMGLHRFVASRYGRPSERRRYGGDRPSPWEDS
ncbi:hypothetical protein KKH27_09140 [bacterium]|nr:hypothetical protein [bacterium]MBU1984728.1 hypothetical protein [bacterium]